MKDFTDKVAVITGAGSGIGRALALELAGRGALLALSDIDADTVADTAVRCGKLGATAVSSALDVADRAAVYAHAEVVRGEFGRVNLVINNAGVSMSGDVATMMWEDFEWLMNIDFWGVAHGTKAFLPDVIASGDGHIVNISSAFGLIAVPSRSAYSSAKFAVRGFTEALRQEMRLAGHPVGVTCVHPGGVKTDIAANARGLPEGVDRERVRRNWHRVAMTRPEAAARVILRGVQRNRPRVMIGADARGWEALPRLLGPRYQDLAVPLYRLGRRAAARRGITF
ncbi:SDR family NAD(P)-dependent oxidoreductase [Nocardia terpenica]|uniref:Acetoin dehydrogenase n=1 Tax=Nocardia terpenica TaxID=455432 RepID=A0A291RXR7_9NOCA|nr:SDR family NAD(P)-dependent oxidoreductase [Nocardia terpenica]ATL72323.1 acetoin dehydrogenase [Nocardia terpenica]